MERGHFTRGRARNTKPAPLGRVERPSHELQLPRRPRTIARPVSAQPASKYEVSSISCTALACTRKDRPTRTAGSSPLWTSRYTVILETLIRAATSATVRNCVLACWPSAEPASRTDLPPADGPFVDVIATQSCQARAMPMASPPLAPTRAYKRRIAGLVGLLVLVGDNQFKILELF